MARVNWQLDRTDIIWKMGLWACLWEVILIVLVEMGNASPLWMVPFSGWNLRWCVEEESWAAKYVLNSLPLDSECDATPVTVSQNGPFLLQVGFVWICYRSNREMYYYTVSTVERLRTQGFLSPWNWVPQQFQPGASGLEDCLCVGGCQRTLRGLRNCSLT